MAEITPERPERIPALSPAIAFTPAERRVLLFRLVWIAERTFAATARPVSDMG